MRKIAQCAKSVVDRHHDDAVLREGRAVIDPTVTHAMRSTVDPEQHGRILRILRRGDVELQAVFGRRAISAAAVRLVVGQHHLRARCSCSHRVAYALPSLHGLRRRPAQVTHWRRCEWNVAKHGDAALDRALYDPAFDGRPFSTTGIFGSRRAGADRHSRK